MKDKITLKSVTLNDYEFLYNLLSERSPNMNISHKKMPTYQQHVRFVKSKPYSKWYIIYHNDEKAGSIYLTGMNEIGIFIAKKFQRMKIGNKALRLIIQLNPKKRYLANVSPSNKKSIEFFTMNRFHLIQYTYEINKKM